MTNLRKILIKFIDSARGLPSDRHLNSFTQTMLIDPSFRLGTISGSIAFFILWSAVPAIYFAIELFKFINPELTSYLVLYLEKIDAGEEVINLVGQLMNIGPFNHGFLSIFFLLIMIYSVSKVARIIIVANEVVYNKREPIIKTYKIYIKGMLFTIIFYGLLFLLTAGYGLFSEFYSLLAGTFTFEHNYSFLIRIVEPFILFLTMWIIYTLTNPVTHKFKKNIYGSVVTTVFISFLVYIYKYLLQIFYTYSIYSAFSSILITFILLYWCCYGFTIGLLVNSTILKIGGAIDEI